MKRSKSKGLNLRVLDVEEMTAREMASVAGGGWWSDFWAGLSDMWEVSENHKISASDISDFVDADNYPSAIDIMWSQ